MGQDAICDTPVESIGTTRAQFLRAYEQMAATEAKRETFAVLDGGRVAALPPGVENIGRALP